MQRAVVVDEAGVSDEGLRQRARTSASIPVIVLRLLVIFALAAGFVLYFVVDGDEEAPDTFSLTSWFLMLLPPTALALSLILGRWLRVAHASMWQVSLSRASAAAATLGIVLTTLFSLLWFYGELFDYAIG